MRRLALVGAALVEVALGASPRLRGARVLGAGEAEECVLDCVAGTCVAREALGLCSYEVEWGAPAFVHGGADEVAELVVARGDSVVFFGDGS